LAKQKLFVYLRPVLQRITAKNTILRKGLNNARTKKNISAVKA